jgi:nucleotide-binding universal stress UspA family protein
MFNNILVLVDGSDFSLNAAKVGASMADKYGSKLTLMACNREILQQDYHA